MRKYQTTVLLADAVKEYYAGDFDKIGNALNDVIFELWSVSKHEAQDEYIRELFEEVTSLALLNAEDKKELEEKQC